MKKLLLILLLFLPIEVRAACKVAFHPMLSSGSSMVTTFYYICAAEVDKPSATEGDKAFVTATQQDYVWTNGAWVENGGFSLKTYSMPDNTDVALYTVTLASSNTGCVVHVSFCFEATGGGNTVSHTGIAIFAFTNNGGTVTGSASDSGESINGTGCGPGCDSYPVTVVSTTATAKANFNNTLGVTGILHYTVLNNTCPVFVRQ